MTVIKAYGKLPAVSAHTLMGGGASISVDDGNVSISLAFSHADDLHQFASAVAEVSANLTEDPRCSMPDGPVGNADGYTDGEPPHDVENCEDPRCEEPECLKQRELEAGERRADERREARA